MNVACARRHRTDASLRARYKVQHGKEAAPERMVCMSMSIAAVPISAANCARASCRPVGLRISSLLWKKKQILRRHCRPSLQATVQ
jgi:hypothetical protein